MLWKVEGIISMGEIGGEINHKEREFPKRRILEIGIGFMPYYKRFAKEDEELSKNDQYIGFDITTERLQSASKYEDVKLVRGDGVKLPFADESMDEVVLPDILNSHVVGENETEKLNDGSIQRVSYDKLDRYKEFYKEGFADDLKNRLIQIVNESIRVLKTAGVLKIIQRLSIENDVRGRQPFDEVLEYISKHEKLQNWQRELRPEPNSSNSREGLEILVITVTKK